MTKEEALSEQFKKAVIALEEVLESKTTSLLDAKIIRDSAIQRFEFTFDLCWKLLKTMLDDTHGVLCASPKSCLREAFKMEMINEDPFWLEIVEMRNDTTHIYSEKIADDVFKKLPKVLKKFEFLLKSLS